MDDSTRFRMRARHCRALADDARDPEAKRTLLQMARELDEEADGIESNDANPQQDS